MTQTQDKARAQLPMKLCKTFIIPLPIDSPIPSTRRGSRKRRPSQFLNNNYILNAVLNAETKKLEEYRHLIKRKYEEEWTNGNIPEIARLAQGLTDVQIAGTNTIRFIQPQNLPLGRMPT